jgi:hypothetical protein
MVELYQEKHQDGEKDETVREQAQAKQASEGKPCDLPMAGTEHRE